MCAGYHSHDVIWLLFGSNYGIVEHMGKRGPKPVDIGFLNFWEYEWCKALHHLRDGVALPVISPWTRQSRRALLHDARTRLVALRAVTVEAYCREWVSDGPHTADEREALCAHPANLRAAEHARAAEMAGLERVLERPRLDARRAIWRALVEARTPQAVTRACARWARMPDARGAGWSGYADHIRTHTTAFLAMKRNVRFPRAPFADDARLDYVARGMAGVMVGVSPTTGDERLRNLKHTPGGPLWNEPRHCCDCWRCDVARQQQLWDHLSAGGGSEA